MMLKHRPMSACSARAAAVLGCHVGRSARAAIAPKTRGNIRLGSVGDKVRGLDCWLVSPCIRWDGATIRRNVIADRGDVIDRAAQIESPAWQIGLPVHDSVGTRVGCLFDEIPRLASDSRYRQGDYKARIAHERPFTWVDTKWTFFVPVRSDALIALFVARNPSGQHRANTA
jgi:hypothetical protein